MKPPILLALSFALLTGCQSQADYTDNGNPGQIEAHAFYDDNRNGVLDSGETGAPIELSISQEVSCPAPSLDDLTIVQADAQGQALFEDLEPGKYCVAPVRNPHMTTQMTQEVYVSSDAVTTVMFGIAGE